MIAERWNGRVPQLGLPFDSMLRKMAVAENCHAGLAAALGPGDRRLVILSPPGTAAIYSVRSGGRVEQAPEGSPRYNLFQAVLSDGGAVRAMFPQLESVRLDEHLVPADTAGVLAANRVDGSVIVFGRGPAASLALARFWASVGLLEPARLHLREAAALYPEDSSLAGLAASFRREAN